VTEGSDLAPILLFVADDLERQAYRYAGALRAGARRLMELEREREARQGSTTGCEWCGEPLLRAETGRPRRFCSDAHRKKAGKSGKRRLIAR
jgi:hypothetical protein